ncbi:MAG: 3-oxoacyl-[acyl-carrier protein] reductase [Actinomycetota bacterium]|nr:3-oxoacyl-[acyl-carrier protein] reductase [Actinomycetota bacterium]
METDLAGKGVLVTGGGGGIGGALVRAFGAEGSRVGVHFRSSRERAEELAQEVDGAALKADLTVESEVDALIPHAVEALGRLDVVVANAGDWPEDDEPIWKMSFERWRATIAANLDSVFLTCRAFLRHVESTGVGNIVIISSTAGLFGEAGHADYAAAKGALASGFALSLKNEIVRIAPNGRVNVVCPGWTLTPMARASLEDPQKPALIQRTMALQKLGEAEDVARVVVSLASDRVSGHVTGQVITVAGGMEGRVLHELD